MREIKFDEMISSGKKRGAFLAITAWTPIYKYYDAISISREARDALYPLVLMLKRWDGKEGFVGGFVEDHETTEDALVRETMEEAGVLLQKFPDCLVMMDAAEDECVLTDRRVTPLIAHEADAMAAYLYHLPLGVVDAENLRRIMTNAARTAEHIFSEGCLLFEHLGDYGREKGWEKLHHSNTLSPMVREELEILRDTLYASAPPGAWPKIYTL